MWICLNNAFFSIVAPKKDPDDRLVVRARRKGDIEKVFGVPGVFSPGRDYAYRALLERDAVASVVMCCVLGINYDNFKNSVRDDRLHSAYSRVWSVMGGLQVGGPYSTGTELRRTRRVDPVDVLGFPAPRRAKQRRLPLPPPVFVPCSCGLTEGSCTCKSQQPSESELADRLSESLSEAEAWERDRTLGSVTEFEAEFGSL